MHFNNSRAQLNSLCAHLRHLAPTYLTFADVGLLDTSAVTGFTVSSRQQQHWCGAPAMVCRASARLSASEEGHVGASQDVLHSWLCRLLVCTVLPLGLEDAIEDEVCAQPKCTLLIDLLQKPKVFVLRIDRELHLLMRSSFTNKETSCHRLSK
jgi:hypothetical protein